MMFWCGGVGLLVFRSISPCLCELELTGFCCPCVLRCAMLICYFTISSIASSGSFVLCGLMVPGLLFCPCV